MQQDASGVVAAVRDALTLQGTNAYRAAQAAGLPQNSIRYLLEGREPKLSRMIEICRALDLEFYVGPPRVAPAHVRGGGHSQIGDAADDAGAPLPSDTDTHLWADRRGAEVTPYPVPMREGHAPERVGFSPNGCAHFGLDFLLNFDLNPKLCEVVEIRDDSMAPEFPAGAAGLVDLRRTERAEGRVYALGVPYLTVRRAMRGLDGWAAVADNPAFEVLPWADDFMIVGQIVWTSHMVDVELAVA